jgi:hypothetical protein
MCDNLESIIYYIVDLFCIGNRYVILFVSLFINCLPHHYICLVGIYVTT